MGRGREGVSKGRGGRERETTVHNTY